MIRHILAYLAIFKTYFDKFLTCFKHTFKYDFPPTPGGAVDLKNVEIFKEMLFPALLWKSTSIEAVS